MYRRILLASDFSAPATAGARLAATLAAPDASFLALHVAATVPSAAFGIPAVGLDPVPAMGMGQAARAGATTAQDLEQTRHRLHAWIGETGLRDADGVVVQGDPARSILDEAKEHGADLLVLGTRGHSRVEEVLVGSVSHDIVRRARCDVLLAEDTPHQVPPRRIAVAVAFDETDEPAFARARDLADHHQAELVLVHVIGPGVQTGATYDLLRETPTATEDAGWLERGVERRLQELNRRHLGGRARVMLARGHLAAELARLAHEARADLLVLGHHETGLLERLLLGSLPEAVARRPPCSTLIVQG